MATKKKESAVDTRRIKNLNDKPLGTGPIFYWLSRDQRVFDNWALLYAQELAIMHKRPLAVVFCLTPEFLGATWRQYDFLLRGLEELEKTLLRYNIPFFLVLGHPSESILTLAKRWSAGAIVTDFDPLRIKSEWRQQVAKKANCLVTMVDAHNIVPCWQASPKQEFGAYTIRPKIKKLLPEFLRNFPALRRQTVVWPGKESKVNWTKARNGLKIDKSVAPVDWLKPGEKAARLALADFIKNRLDNYDERRNNPNLNGQSDLSPYLHFGQLAAARVALVVKESTAKTSSTQAFLEELIIRRELADNFCFYNSAYDRFAGFPKWAQNTLLLHSKDKRAYQYSRGQLEKANTHDNLWNASQQQMVTRGKMHGYLRMYWAKKILEWSKSPQEALATAIYLNDKYELDGRDPNGYAGISWSLGGLHDRAWGERPIFGKIRYMNYEGCRRKFKVEDYIDKYQRPRPV